jgi:hypothetical protein
MFELIENEDFYWEERDGIRYRVFTELYFFKNKKFCCGSGCRHCIFEPKHKRNAQLINEEIILKFKEK